MVYGLALFRKTYTQKNCGWELTWKFSSKLALHFFFFLNVKLTKLTTSQKPTWIRVPFRRGKVVFISHNFWKNLFDFSIKSDEVINEFGGVTIFAGGDDLLFFAPIVNKDKNIFDLINTLSNVFENIFKKYNLTSNR